MVNPRDAVSREENVATKKAKNGSWIQGARKRMEEKGTVGKFGKATPKKVAAAKKKGGVEEKRAVFAENMRKLAAKRKHRGTAMKGKSSSSRKSKGARMRKGTALKR